MGQKILFQFVVLGVLSLVGCKISSAGPAGDSCNGAQGCEGPFGQKPNDQLTGTWVSANSIVVGPMTYYKTMAIAQNQIKFTQICSRQDGVAVTASIVLDTQFSQKELDFGVGGDREEYRYGISCRIQLDGGPWSYRTLGNGGTIELTNRAGNQTLRFVRSSN